MKALRSLLLVGLVFGLAFVVFAFRAGNDVSVDLDLLWMRIPNVELWSALAAALGLGGVLGAIVVGTAWLRQRLLNRRQRKEIERLEKEIHRLRALPIAGAQGAVEAEAARPRFSLGRS